jgi:uncharacterized membrane protein
MNDRFGWAAGGTVPERPLPLEAYRRMTLVLRVGLVASLLILGGGLIAYLTEKASHSADSVVHSNPILQYLNLPGLWSGLLGGSVEAYLTLGLLVLVATPIVRVISGLYYFQRGGERAMTAITFSVVVLLLVGLLVLGPWIR